MGLKKVLATFLILTSSSAIAKSSLCDVSPINAEKKIKINGVPGFFFKVHPEGNYLSYIGNSSNVLLDLNSGVGTPLPGDVDPVWSPDGEFLSIPGDVEDRKGIQIFPARDMLQASKKGSASEVKASLVETGGMYQSIAKVGDHYKMINDQSGVSLFEFSYANQEVKLLKEVRRPCPNVPDMGTDLPMISKDGKYLSVYDQKHKSTKIYKFKGDNCSLALDLGLGTGKVSFNSDSSQIAFHIDQFGDFEEGYFSGIAKDKVKNIVVLNLSAKDDKLIPTSWAMASEHVRPGDGGYYPDFDRAGNVYFMEDIENNYQVVKVSPKQLDFYPMISDLKFAKGSCVNCEEQNKDKGEAVKALAKLWGKVCPDLKGGPEVISALDPENCQNLIEKFWTPALGVSKVNLLKTCPGKKSKPLEIGVWDPHQKKGAEEVIKAKCMTCHSQAYEVEAEMDTYVDTGDPQTFSSGKAKVKKRAPKIDLVSLDEKLVAEMLKALITDRMPKGEPLSVENKELVLNYLKKKQLDLGVYYPQEIEVIRRYSDARISELLSQTITSEMTALDKEKNELFIRCYYGQQKCQEMIKAFTPMINKAAKGLDKNLQKPFVDDAIMKLKCMNQFDVTLQQCVNWEENRNPAFDKIEIGFQPGVASQKSK